MNNTDYITQMTAAWPQITRQVRMFLNMLTAIAAKQNDTP